MGQTHNGHLPLRVELPQPGMGEVYDQNFKEVNAFTDPN